VNEQKLFCAYLAGAGLAMFAFMCVLSAWMLFLLLGMI
jgi:hypothetical protein